jgi:putative hemolysin
MIPRPQIKAIEITSSHQFILDTIQSAGVSRFPVYKGRLDNIEGVIHAKDIIPYLIDNKEIKLESLLRKPLFLPENASLEKTLLQMQKMAIHLVFVVDEFGSMEGIVTLEDIIEEIVGEIQDEHDAKEEDFYVQIEENVYMIRGGATIKDINQRLFLEIPEKSEYTTLAGFFLHEFGKIPHEGQELSYKDLQLVVERMSKHRIGLLRVIKKTAEKREKNENHRDE